MTTNTFARPFFDFINTHDLSLYKVAKNAGISEGTLRSFRDVEGRQLNPQTRTAVASALCHLTREPINVIQLFGSPEERAEARAPYILEPAPNERFADILWQRSITKAEFAKITGIPMGPISDLIHNKPISAAHAKQIADALNVAIADIGAEIEGASNKVQQKFLPSEHYVSLPRDLPILSLSRAGGVLVMAEKPIGFTVRPPSLLGNDDAYAIYAPDDGMAPRYRSGELIYVDPHWPSQPTADVIVWIRSGDGAGSVLFASLTMQEGGRSAFTFYTRRDTFVLDNENISIHKVLRGQELIIR